VPRSGRRSWTLFEKSSLDSGHSLRGERPTSPRLRFSLNPKAVKGAPKGSAVCRRADGTALGPELERAEVVLYRAKCATALPTCSLRLPGPCGATDRSSGSMPCCRHRRYLRTPTSGKRASSGPMSGATPVLDKRLAFVALARLAELSQKSIMRALDTQLCPGARRTSQTRQTSAPSSLFFRVRCPKVPDSGRSIAGEERRFLFPR
jgi:hypothetical protein